MKCKYEEWEKMMDKSLFIMFIASKDLEDEFDEFCKVSYIEELSQDEDDEETKYEEWLNSNSESLVDDFLLDNKEFDRICRETYELEKEKK